MSDQEHPPTATDASTLTEVLAGYADSGYDGSFGAVADAQLQCYACNETFPVGDAPMASQHRLEGASDPADMLAVIALTCPRCSVRGTAVLSYGPIATPEDSDVLAALRDRRGATDLPANSAPGEAARDDGAPTS